MAAKHFHISKPEELQDLSKLIKEGKLGPMVSVWTAAVRKNGKCRWNNAIYACFSGDRHRVAEVYRISAEGEPIYCATLHYNKALNWCEQHLQPVYD